jgi:hypothetical protein
VFRAGFGFISQGWQVLVAVTTAVFQRVAATAQALWTAIVSAAQSMWDAITGFCTIELRVPRKTPSLLVPANAIIFNSDGLQVAAVEDGIARIRKMSVGRDFGTEVEAVDGVKAGDQVILRPKIWVQFPHQAPIKSSC